MNVKVLDCTLRDGGYINNWEFGFSNIKFIISNLNLSKIDYLECGFLKNIFYNKDKSLFNSIQQLFELLREESTIKKCTLMINFNEYELSNILKKFPQGFNFRVAFKKYQMVEALKFCDELVKNGYNISINPMHTIDYSFSELVELVEITNNIKPHTFTIVDTNGQMDNDDTLSLFYIVNKNLESDIAIGFHSHNSLQLSFSNTQALLMQNIKRDIIIDSTVFGMGRGAGNLSTEVLLRFLNNNYNTHYDLIYILKILDEIINPIFTRTPWGYSVPYQLAALNLCHPNYATFLLAKKNVNVEKMNLILSIIPKEKKSYFDEALISELYSKNI